MFKFFCLIALIATVYGVPVHESDTELKTSTDIDSPKVQSIPLIESASINSDKAVGSLPSAEENLNLANDATDAENEKESLEGAEFGWGFRSYGWGYPIYRSYYYPSYYYPIYRPYRYYW